MVFTKRHHQGRGGLLSVSQTRMANSPVAVEWELRWLAVCPSVSAAGQVVFNASKAGGRLYLPRAALRGLLGCMVGAQKAETEESRVVVSSERPADFVDRSPSERDVFQQNVSSSEAEMVTVSQSTFPAILGPHEFQASRKAGSDVADNMQTPITFLHGPEAHGLPAVPH